MEWIMDSGDFFCHVEERNISSICHVEERNISEILRFAQNDKEYLLNDKEYLLNGKEYLLNDIFSV